MSSIPVRVEVIFKRVGGTLTDAGLSADAIAEVSEMLARSPKDAVVAVLGRHNHGKTTLIAVITEDEKAAADISHDVQTQAAQAYEWIVGDAQVAVWDTPGLGSEELRHDAIAADVITRADAVVVACSTELMSDEGKDQLVELLRIGRKKGAVLPVLTKADREQAENYPAATSALGEMLGLPGEEVVIIGDLHEALDEAIDSTPMGLDQLREGLSHLVETEARHRVSATAAVRLLALTEQAAEELEAREPEHRVELTFQRRLKTILARADRRINSLSDSFARKLRLAGLRAAVHAGEPLEDGVGAERVALAGGEAWDQFVEAVEQSGDGLEAAIQVELANLGTELERLEQGPLATALREVAAELERDPGPEVTSEDLEGWERARRILGAASSVSSGLAGGIMEFGKHVVPVGNIVDIGTTLGEEAVGQVIEQKRSAIRDQLRSDYLERAEAIGDAWGEQVEVARDGTTRAALAQTEQLEDELFRLAVNAKAELESLSEARDELDKLISEATTSGHIDDRESAE